MKRAFALRQRGVALIALMAIVVLAVSWMLVSRLNAASASLLTADRQRNAAALSQAKQALIGWMAMQAAKAGEDNPGRLPCPEHPWYIGNPAKEGLAGPSVGVSNPGVGAPSANCTSLGRLPWRSIGTDKLVDASSEPLWLVVGPAWRITSSSSKLTLNSNSAGDTTVDGQQVVALIIAPGPAISSAAAAGCVARNQARSAPSPAMDARDYLECFDAATLQFTTTASSASLNDQMVKITVADVVPVLEAAVANRIEREIVPQLKAVYASASWGLSTTNPLLPYPAPFSNPGTSTYQGAPGTVEGLLPFTYSAGCTPATDPRCSTTFVVWNTAATPTMSATGGTVLSASCSASSTVAQCNGTYEGVAATNNVQLRMRATAKNVAMTLKQLDATQIAVAPGGTVTPSAAFNSDGSAAIFADLPASGQGVGTPVPFSISANIGVLADHALLDSSMSSATGWFVRNEWYRLTYYAVAPGHTAAGLPAPSCASSTTCLSVANVAPAGKQRAILILAGQSVNGSARPSANLADYLEFGNALSAFERQTVSVVPDAALKRPFNDRIVVVDSNP